MTERHGKSKLLLLLALPLVVGSLLAVPAVRHALFRKQAPEPLLPDDPPVEDPRLTFVTPFTNVRPEVKYVGDAACAQCHPTEAQSYSHHSMGRSFFAVKDLGPRQRYDAAAHNPFTAVERTFTVERRGERVFHKQTWPDGRGGTVCAQEVEVAYVIGSGSRGHSYLVERDGRLVQSAVSWYSQKEIWDLSPGFGAAAVAGRPIVVQCLFCHTNHAEHVPHTVNRYRPPIRAEAIGCERCHGPGELHVQRRESAEVVNGIDTTIVNPRHLSPELREAVCEQCHLEAQGRVLRRGRDTFDFRPGLPLHLFWSVFSRTTEHAGRREAVSHVEQMHESRCFQASAGRLGCISCHDAHLLPEAKVKDAYYRDRCLRCHQQKGCSEAAAARAAKNDSCTACHMPRSLSADIAHTAVTDHRVLRRPDPPDDHPEPPKRLERGQMPLRYFFSDVADASDPEVERDLGLALMELARSQLRFGRILAELAIPPLSRGIERAPGDVPALEARGLALQLLDRRGEAWDSYQAVLRRVPTREMTLVDAAYVAESLGRHDEAIALWERARDVNPYFVLIHYELARVRANRAQAARALEACEEALRLDPGHTAARQILVACLLRQGSRDRAEEEFDKLLQLRPSEAVSLRAWFAREVGR